MSVPVIAEPPPVVPFQEKPKQYWWLWVLCLLGVDYFSTLAYQPSIAFQVAGRLAPIATLLVVLATLFGALPIYFYVAGKSAHGQGSIALLERLVHGWRGKTLILMLLGFAATDFVMIKSLSLADAAEHVNHNSVLMKQDTLKRISEQAREWGRDYLGETITDFFDPQLVTTILLGLLGFVFWFLLRNGFNRNILILAVPTVGLFLLLNGIVLGHGISYLVEKPILVEQWWQHVQAGDWGPGQPSWPNPGWEIIALFCVLYLPQLALGLSGFELSLIVMPQVRGKANDSPTNPKGRVRNTRKILMAAAVIMSIYLTASVTVTSLLIPPDALQAKATADNRGLADNRALAYLAHGGALADGSKSLGPFFGPEFGSLYDVVTVALLCLAGTSVMTALANLLPQFLLRFGMELKWATKWGLLLALFALVNLLVTLYFRAEVSDQRGAYATAVLVLMTSAAAVSVLSKKLKGSHFLGLLKFPWWNALVAGFFAALTAAVIAIAPTGLMIAFAFIVTILLSSVFARAIRSDELRTIGFDFVSPESKFLWDSLRIMDFPILVPHRPGMHERGDKEQSIRRDHQLDPDADIVFLEVEVDDPSNFYQRLRIDLLREEKSYIIKVTQCVSVPHAIAAIALEMSKESKPPGVHFGWSEMDLLAASWSYFAFGEGNVPWKVRELLLEAEPDRLRRPRVIIG